MQADKFRPVLATVFESTNTEIVINKQPILTEHGREIRAAVNQLPVELNRELMSSYSEPSMALISKIESAIAQKEFAITNESENTADQEWLASGKAHARSNIDESNLGSDDEWNAPAY